MGDYMRILYAASNMRHINNFHMPYIDSLRKMGHVVEVMARGEGADYNIPFEKKLFSRQNAGCRERIHRILADERFDAIILNTALAAFHIRLALPRNGRPTVLNIVHGYLFSRDIGFAKRVLFILCEWLLRSRTDRIITMNSEDQEWAESLKLSRYGARQSRGMGVRTRDVVTSPENIRCEYMLEGKYTLCFVGELSKRKNQKFLIDALRELKCSLPNAVLLLVGDGGERESLMRRAVRAGLSESVIFTGHRREACDFIRASDLYVSASRIEGLPFNIVEALGVGATVLASDIKGHRDVITDGVDGFLYKHGDALDFVNKCLQIAENKLEIMPENAKNKYEMFQYDSVFPETLGLILKAVS